MLQSPFKSMVARTAIFALVLALAISFFTVGLAPSATAQTANDDPCKQDATTKVVTCDYDENGTDPVANFSAMDPEGENIAWSLDGDDAADFDITGGVLSFVKSPNFENTRGAGGTADNRYDVMVVATEIRAPGSIELAQSNDIRVVVNVKNVEEDPTLTLNRLQVRPGVSPAVTVEAEVTDPDVIDGTPNYQWYVPKVSRPDLENEDHWNTATGGGNNTATYTAVAADAGKYLRVVATYTDGAGTDTDKAYARSAHPVAAVRAANTRPGFPAGTPNSFTLSEHVAVGTVIGTVRGSDIDSSDILTHELTAETGTVNVGKFEIDPATGRIKVASKLDYETAPDATATGRTGTGNKDYTFTITVYDPSGAVPEENTDPAAGPLVSGTGALTVYVKVTDQNDAPGKPTVGVIATTDTAPSNTNRTPVVDQADPTVPSYKVNENSPVKDVAEVTADPTATPPVEAVAAEWAVVVATFAVTDTDPPTDPDGGTSDTLGDPASSLKLTAGGVDGGLFTLTDTGDFGGTLDDNTYELVFKEEPNYESPADADGNNKYHVTIITADNEGATSELPIVITVENVNEDGMVTLSTSQPAVGQPITATLTDPDMKMTGVTWQWGRSDSTSGFIPIPGATSDTYTPVRTVEDDPVTTENEGIDGDEGKFLEVTVKYRDNASPKEDDPGTTDVDESKVVNTVPKATANAVREAPDVNQAPAFESGITREVPEDAETGDSVGGPVTANDPDGDALTYSITGGADMGAFEIGPTSGQITVKKGTKLDFEGSQTTYVVEVTASDPFGLSDSTMVTITVTDVNEKPELTLQPGGTTQPTMGVVGGRANVSVQEGTTAVGTYTAPSDISSPSWTLSGVDMSSFRISGGALSFRSAPDYESPGSANGDNVYMVTVMASGGGNSAELAVTVTVTDDPSDNDTGGGGFDALASYDANNNGQIDRPEVIMAIRDYFDNGISQDDVRAVIRAYATGS